MYEGTINFIPIIAQAFLATLLHLAHFLKLPTMITPVVFNVLIFYLLIPFLPAKQVPDPIVLEGATMGTTYRIVYFDPVRQRNFDDAIDSLLQKINRSINTYDPEAEISLFNKSEKGVCVELPFLYRILKKAKTIHKQSGGAFDPTIMPLVNAWGFGPGESFSPTKREVDSLRELVGFKYVRFSRTRIRKTRPGVQLDMGGIGQGFGADMIFNFLKDQGIEHMLVELGGEGMASGRNLQKDKSWTIGILDPNSTVDQQFFKAYVTLQDGAFTTSGNYFNYKVVEGRKFGHTIDPVSGYPVQHSLLSVSVFADDCTTADGWATAFMVMGTEKAIATAKSLRGMDVLFMYSNEAGGVSTYITPGFEKNITLE